MGRERDFIDNKTSVLLVTREKKELENVKYLAAFAHMLETGSLEYYLLRDIYGGDFICQIYGFRIIFKFQ